VLKSSAPNRTAGTDPGAVAVSGPAGYVGRCASREKTEFSCFQRIQTHQMTAHEHDNLSLVPRTIRHLSLSPSTCQDLTPDPYFPTPDPPFDIETFEPIEPPWQAIREWIPDDDAEPGGDLFDQRPDSGKPVEIRREDGSILVLDSD